MDKANMSIEPGILAMIFGLVIDTQDNGKVVEVLFYGKETDDYIWEQVGWICSHESFEGGVESFSDKNLMPIRPEYDTINDNSIVFVTYI